MTPLPLLALLAVGCAPVDPDVALTPFSSCEDLTDYMRRMARQEVLYRYRWEPGDYAIIPGASKDYALSEDAGGTQGATSYSTTNIQEAGVDEADLVKTDGTWLYSLSGTHLVISRAWPVDELAMAATVKLDGAPRGIYLYGDLVVAESQVWGPGEPRDGQRPARRTDEWVPRTLVTLVDVSDPQAPRVIREVYAEGELVESRRIGQRLFVVTYQDIGVDVYAENARQARQMVDAAVSDDWLPWVQDHRFDGAAWVSDERPSCDCTDVWGSEREGGTFFTSALSIDLDDPSSDFDGAAVVGEAETVYASTGSLYVAANEYEEGPFPSIDGSIQTILHKFDISADQPHPSYAASAKVMGTLEDRFGLSEHEGVLRVATTEWGDTSWATVTTLQEEGGVFSQLDSLDRLGEGEEIYATRFTGDVGYVVTYEQIDPLFTIDLSDPGDIRLAGALEMDGWSDYLHPMDSTHLLAVGQDADWNLQVSLFDVGDLEHPRLVDRVSLDAYGSEAQYEPHAFNYFADQDALAIPAWTTSEEPALEILEATPEGLSYTGRLRQEEVLARIYEPWCAPVRRSVIFEDQAMAVSNAGLTVAPLSDPGTVANALPFEGLDPCDAYEYDYSYDYGYYYD
ncbi:beta-propeller domain-containing protein [Myxococcota bacterium]|nr:beta-propeller domain-containing protein [Myxococcota bacterium]